MDNKQINSEEYNVLFNAYVLACKYLQKHPPAQLSDSMEEIIAVVGSNTYEDGWIQWARYFINKANNQNIDDYDEKNLV